SGINNAVSRTASVLALALLGVLAVAVFGWSLDTQLASLPLTAETMRAMVDQHARLAAAELPPNLDAVTVAQLRDAIAGAFVASFRVVVFVGAALALAASFCALLTIESGIGADRLRSERDQAISADSGMTEVSPLRH
ncbi:MAG TPA: hypothetical protein VGK54_13170, partial [Chloroflexota bacterium]